MTYFACSNLLKNTGVPAGISDAGIGLTGHPSTMIDELIDLTTMQPSKVLRTRFTRTDLMWIVVVGGVPYLAREAFRYLLMTCVQRRSHIGSEEPLAWSGRAVRFAPLPSACPRKALGAPIRRSHRPSTV